MNVFTVIGRGPVVFVWAVMASALAGGAARAADAPAPRPILTNVQQVLDLGPYTARRLRQPARLRGTVTYVGFNPTALFLHDGTASIMVYATNTPPGIAQGKIVEAEGLTESGLLAPILIRGGLTLTGEGPMPAPVRLPVARMQAGEGCWQYVRVEGVVRDMNRDASNLALAIAAQGRRFIATIYGYSRFHRSGLPLDWLEARVAVDGICWTDVNDRNQPTTFHLILGNTNQVQLLASGHADLFALPALMPDDAPRLRQPSDVRLRLTGTVTAKLPGDRFFLETRFGPVQARLDPFISRGMPNTQVVEREPPTPLHPGDQIEMIGAPTESAFAPFLLDAAYRITGRAAAPTPTPADVSALAEGLHDARLVRLEARLLAHERRATGDGFNESLVLEGDQSVFEAAWPTTGTNALPAFPLNARLQVDGICVVQPGPGNVRRTFQILLRGPEDIAYLGQPPFWASWPLRRLAGFALGLFALAGIWIYFLRRQVRERTAELVRFAAIADTTKDLVVITDLRRRLIYLNPAGRVMLGWMGNPSEESPEDLSKLFGESAGPILRERAIPAALREGNWSGELTLRHRDGREIPVSMVGLIIRTPTGRPQHFAAIVRDITDRKRTEVELQKAITAEKELSALRSRFVSMVSHEFRTPLGVILSSSDLLEGYLDRLTPERRAELLGDIRASTRRMSELMEEVLFLSRADAGRLSCRPEPLRLRGFCEALLVDVRAATQGRCPIRLDASDEPAAADHALLRHIVTNLTSNAVKYSRPGSPVDVRVTRDGIDAVFEFVDRGIGIPDGDARGLFQPFHRAANVGAIPGTGLGLTIVKRCVDLHGGAITWRSREGEGTTFIVRLPLFDPPPGSASSRPSNQTPPTTLSAPPA